jgi:hypothetical protein
MPWKNIKLVPRSDDEPKFNAKNATDRKILTSIIVSCSILVVIAVILFILYFSVFR